MADVHTAIEPFLAQIEQAADAGLYYLALMGALALPDFGASLSDANGKSGESKYRAWVEQWMGYDQASALRLYKFRCALLHEASFVPHAGKGSAQPARILFLEPGPGRVEVHGPQSVLHYTVDGKEYTPIAVRAFIGEILAAIRKWITACGGTNVVIRNSDKVVQRYPEGLGPFAGAPVIG